MTALINGSPKAEGSSSEILVSRFEKIETGNPDEIKKIHLGKCEVSSEDMEILKACDTWVFFFPLYVDALPGHLVDCLLQIEKAVKEPKKVYAVVCMGFFEGIQTRHALSVMENFCLKSGFKYCGGIGVGGAGAFGGMKGIPLYKGPLIEIDMGLKELRENAWQGKTAENIFVGLKFPRFLYRLAGESNWKKVIKENGGKAKDLGRKIR